MFKTIAAAVIIAIVGFVLVSFVGFGISDNGAAGVALGLFVGILIGVLVLNSPEIESKPATKAQIKVQKAPSGQSQSNTISIFVGNLAYKARGKQLAQLFEPFGEILSIRIVKDRETGRAKGFGFVEMHAADARNAIANLDGQEFFGRSLKVSEANTQKPE